MVLLFRFQEIMRKGVLAKKRPQAMNSGARRPSHFAILGNE